MNLNSAAVNEYRLEGLNAEPVQGRCPVEQYRTLFNHFLQNIVDFRLGPLYQPAGTLDIGRQALRHQAAHDKGFEELQCHPPG